MWRVGRDKFRDLVNSQSVDPGAAVYDCTHAHSLHALHLRWGEEEDRATCPRIGLKIGNSPPNISEKHTSPILQSVHPPLRPQHAPLELLLPAQHLIPLKIVSPDLSVSCLLPAQSACIASGSAGACSCMKCTRDAGRLSWSTGIRISVCT